MSHTQDQSRMSICKAASSKQLATLQIQPVILIRTICNLTQLMMAQTLYIQIGTIFASIEVMYLFSILPHSPAEIYKECTVK